MKEKAITIDAKYKYDLANLKRQLKQSNKCLIVSEFEANNEYSILFACEDKDLSTLNNIVAQNIVNFYVFRYKKLYLQQNLNLIDIEKMFAPAYICALAQFDTFTDKEIALDADYTHNKISVIPFLYFRLQNLIQRWKTIINLTNENITAFNKSSAIIDLLRYLVKNLQSNKKELNLQFTENGIKIYDNNTLSFETKSQSKTDIANTIAVLVKLSPQRLIVRSAHPNSHLETIRQIFDEKIVQ